jgi:hypothetical protein
MYRRVGGTQGRPGQVRKISPPPGLDPQTVQSLCSRYTNWATWPTPISVSEVIKLNGISCCLEDIQVNTSNVPTLCLHLLIYLTLALDGLVPDDKLLIATREQVCGVLKKSCVCIQMSLSCPVHLTDRDNMPSFILTSLLTDQHTN